MDDIYENIEKCNQDKEHKILIKFDNMIVDQLSKKDYIQYSLNYLSEVENQTFLLFVLYKHILLCEEILD